MRTTIIWTVALALLVPAVASARRENPLEGQPAIRHKEELHAARFEIGPSFNMSLNRYVRNAFLIGLKAEYHALDWLSFGFDIGGGFGADTSLAGELKSNYEVSP